jgi:hypothetical protein
MPNACKGILFKIGLEAIVNQIAVEKKMKKRFVVLSADSSLLKDKPTKEWVLSEGESELCVQEGILEAIRTKLRQYEQEDGMKKATCTKPKNGGSRIKKSSGNRAGRKR